MREILGAYDWDEAASKLAQETLDRAMMNGLETLSYSSHAGLLASILLWLAVSAVDSPFHRPMMITHFYAFFPSNPTDVHLLSGLMSSYAGSLASSPSGSANDSCASFNASFALESSSAGAVPLLSLVARISSRRATESSVVCLKGPKTATISSAALDYRGYC